MNEETVTMTPDLKKYWVKVIEEQQATNKVHDTHWLEGPDRHLEWYSDTMGVPMSIQLLAKRIYTSIPNAEAKDFRLKLLKSMPTEKSALPVFHAIAVLRLERMIKLAANIESEIRGVIRCHREYKSCSDEQWVNARDKARKKMMMQGLTDCLAAAAASSSVWGGSYCPQLRPNDLDKNDVNPSFISANKSTDFWCNIIGCNPNRIHRCVAWVFEGETLIHELSRLSQVEVQEDTNNTQTTTTVDSHIKLSWIRKLLHRLIGIPTNE